VVAGILPLTDGQLTVNGRKLTDFDIRQYRARVGRIARGLSALANASWA